MGCYIPPWAAEQAGNYDYDWEFIAVIAAIALVVVTAVGFLRESAAALASWWTRTRHTDNDPPSTP